MNAIERYTRLSSDRNAGYWAKRALAQIGFLLELSRVRGGLGTELIEQTLEALEDAVRSDGALTKPAALAMEEALMPLSSAAKAYTVVCAAHAHIDMNWMWGVEETAAITADTFRTMLHLMDEYPQFTFSQSQASTYRLIETYYPEMIPEIKRRVHEGRWELTASTWVECDKNMPSGESMCRHILYTKNYLSKLFDVSPDSLLLDFEPDTFGHAHSVPEILTSGNVKYYYHCRGYDGHCIYNWKAPSGASVLVYREPQWYNAAIEPDMLAHMPAFCDRYGADVMLKVYGVGDHGGGPTRRDIETLLDMSQWPLLPSIEFGTYHGFFKRLERFRDSLPTVDSDLNYVFTGCYTSQSRIKLANRLGEARLYDAEALSSAALIAANGMSDAPGFEDAWQKHLFNQFHDIITGSGVTETREYAMGAFQQVLARANANASRAMNAITEQIDTSMFATGPDALSRSEGAGVGYGVSDAQPGMIGNTPGRTIAHGLPKTERGRGKARIFHVFNATQFERDEVAEITLWDWGGDLERLAVRGPDGNPLAFEIAGPPSDYWAHTFIKLLVRVCVPPLGYATCLIGEAQARRIPVPAADDPRVDDIGDSDIALENELVRAVFSSRTMKLLSFVDKSTGQNLIDRPSCAFRRILEDDAHGMTAWRVGRYADITDINESAPVYITGIHSGALCQWVSYRVEHMGSTIEALVSLHSGSATLSFDVSVDWRESGGRGVGVPQLQFFAPLGYCASKYRYDVPFGVADRPAIAHDVPATSFACAIPEGDGGALLLTADSKYGYRGHGDALSVSLIRASYDPDETPEYGRHRIRIGLKACADTGALALLEAAERFSHPLHTLSNTSHPGALPPAASLIGIDTGAKLSAIKPCEDTAQRALVARLYNPTAAPQPVSLRFAAAPVEAYMVDVTERRVGGDVSLTDGCARFEIAPYASASVLVRF